MPKQQTSDEVFQAGREESRRILDTPHQGLMWNCCLNPFCPQFGIPIPPAEDSRIYFIYENALRTCVVCKKVSTIKNSQGIKAELNRLSQLRAPPVIYCQRCNDPKIDFVSHPETFNRHGTRQVSGIKVPRFICRCRKTLNPPARPKIGNAQRHSNARIFDDSFNRAPINRIGGTINPLPPSLIVRRQNSFYNQFMLWSRCIETPLLRNLHQKRGKRPPLLLSTDSQQYSLNWSNSKNPNEILIDAITTCDTHSGYIFASDCNHDSSISVEDRQALADHFRPELSRDAQPCSQLIIDKRKSDNSFGQRPQNIPVESPKLSEEEAEEAEVRQASITDAAEPKKWPGARVFIDYTAAAHFRNLSLMLPNVEEMHLLLDGDLFLRTAALAGFRNRIRRGDSQVFIHKYNKNTTQKEKKSKAVALQKKLETMMTTRGIDNREVLVKLLIAERLEELARWPAHEYDLEAAASRKISVPRPHEREPEKEVLCLTTDFSDPQIREDMVGVIARASMTNLDKYFEVIRRDLLLVERPMFSNVQKGKGTNFMYCACSPARVFEMTQIYRIYYNFCRVPKGSKDQRTPAQRLGIIHRRLDPMEILESNPVLDMMLAAKA